MPLYVYQVIEDDGSEGEVFEVLQEMSDPPLTKHPETGKPVQRLIAPPAKLGRMTDLAMKGKMTDKNLEQMGFTKYVRSRDGSYEKTAGSGPRHIVRGDG